MGEARGASATAPDPLMAVDLTSMSIEDLMNVKVYAASKREQRASDAPASISVVGHDEIQRFGYRTLSDILNGQRGLYVTYDRNYSYLGIRGFNRAGDYNTRLLVLLDGHRINENVFNSAGFGYDSIVDVDLIDRLEVIRGPSSSLYGNNAFFGVVNLVTRKPEAIQGVETSFSAGSFDAYGGRVTLGKSFTNGVALTLSGSITDISGPGELYFPEFDDPATNNGISRDNDGEHAASSLLKLSYQDFTLAGAWFSRKKGIATGTYGTEFPSGDHYTTDSQGFVYLKYDHEFDSGTRVLAKASYNDYRFEGDYPYAAVPGVSDRILNRDEAVGRWVTLEAQADQRIKDKHTVTAGAELQQHLNRDQLNFDVGTPDRYLDDRRSDFQWAVFTQGEVQLPWTLRLSAGLRYDHHEQFGGELSPRAGLIANPWKESVVKLLYGRAFRAPNVYELYYTTSLYVANPDLLPETIDTYELVLEQTAWKYNTFSASTFYYQIKDLINQAGLPGTPSLQFQNLDEASAMGLELGWQLALPSGWMAHANVTLQRAEDGATGERLTTSPATLAKLGVSAPVVGETLIASLEGQYFGSVKSLAGETVDPFFLTHLTLLSRGLTKGLEVSASVYNLFDERFGYPVSEDFAQDVLPQDGRTFRVKLTYRF